MRELSIRQLKFVQGILDGKTAKAAYIAAGFGSRGKAAETNAVRLSKKPAVAAAIEAAKQKAADAAEVTAKQVVNGLAAIAFVDIRRLFNADNTLKSPVELDPLTAAAVASIERDEEKRRTTTDEVVTSTIRVKLWDKRLALVDLGKYLGLFRDGVPLPATGDPLEPYAHYTVEELRQLRDIARGAKERATILATSRVDAAAVPTPEHAGA